MGNWILLGLVSIEIAGGVHTAGTVCKQPLILTVATIKSCHSLWAATKYCILAITGLHKTFPCPAQQIHTSALTLVPWAATSKGDWKDVFLAHSPSTSPTSGSSVQQRPGRGGSLQKARWFLRGWDCCCEGFREGEKPPLLLSRDLKAVVGGEAEEFHKRKNYSASSQTTLTPILSDLAVAGLVSTGRRVPQGSRVLLWCRGRGRELLVLCRQINIFPLHIF